MQQDKLKVDARDQKLIGDVSHDFTLVTQEDLYLFNEGNHFRLYNRMGSHIHTHDDVTGTHFAVWAPNAERVSVIGNFNSWDPAVHPLHCRGV